MTDPEGVAKARDKFHCPACGAESNWNPAKQALICPFCGTQSPATLQTHGAETVIVEHDLVAALRNIPDEARGWKAEKISVRCQSCLAISVFEPNKIGKNCDFCGSAALVPYTEVKDAFSPESLLPLKVSESQVRDLIRKWYQDLWFAPSAIRTRALTDTTKGIYLPYWTFDANTHALWTAESGHYHTVMINNKPVVQVRWSPAAGELSHFFDDELVAASSGVHAQWLRQIEPFPTGGLIPYDPGYLAGWTVERYQIDLLGAAETSRRQMVEQLQQLCGKQVPGDTYRNLQVNVTFSDQRFKHILVPVWLLTYSFGARSFQVVVNGVTGKIAGGRPWSWIKITLLILTIIVVIIVFKMASQ